MMKKQLLLFVAMLLPLVAMADASGSCGKNLTWTYTEATQTLTIEGTGAMTNYKSSSNAPWRFSYRDVIEKIIIGPNVTTIGSYAFQGLSKVTFVDIPGTVTSIGDYAFHGCSSLTSISIPNSVTSIGDYAFCLCSSLTSIIIPNSVTSIGSDTFYGCSSLTSIAIPNSVMGIGEYTFANCSSLTSITISDGVKSIGDHAFSGCTGLTLISIGSGVASIDKFAFYGCTNLGSMNVDSGNTTYDSREDCNAIIETKSNTLIVGCQNTTIPNSVTSIGAYAFLNCSGLTSVTIPESVTNIGSSAFLGCDNLSSVTLHCKTIGSWFSGMGSIKDIIIGGNVFSIGEAAFQNCTGLTSITISKSVTSIGQQAFSGCTGITLIKVDSGNTTYDSRENCNAIIETESNTLIVGCQNTTIPNNVTTIGNSALCGCTGLTSISIPTSVTNIQSDAFSGCSSLTTINIPNSVTIIGSSAFSSCSGLASVTIPNSVARIGDKAFYGCSSLTSIAIPNSVTRIGANTFSNCTCLTSIAIPNSVTVIGNEAFWGCSGLTSINIPNSVTDIGIRAFYSSRLENVLTFNSMTTFDKGTFSDRTLQHAMLYVPEGTWGEAVYDGSWYLFNNIREVAMNQEILSPAKAYALMDTKSFGYAVFDGSSDEVKMAKAFYSMDENDLNNCWQVIDKSGAKYLYNIGAKKYAKIASDGKITLTNNETPVNITEGENGLKFGSGTSREWGFVKNNNVTIDNQTSINPVSRTSSKSSSTYFSIDGMQTVQPKKDLNIVRMSDGTTKKVMMK